MIPLRQLLLFERWQLLSLLGHELRAPAGVIGGYLALIERERARLSPTQQQALDGARRGQQAIVETLDDLRRLTLAWKAEDEPVVATSADHLSNSARRAADLGVDGLIVSNHGGRSLDTLPASIEALPAVVQAVEGDAVAFGHDAPQQLRVPPGLVRQAEPGGLRSQTLAEP